MKRYFIAGLLVWLPLVFIFVIFYFLLIMPQQRRQKKWQAMLAELEAEVTQVDAREKRIAPGKASFVKADAVTLEGVPSTPLVP